MLRLYKRSMSVLMGLKRVSSVCRGGAAALTMSANCADIPGRLTDVLPGPVFLHVVFSGLQTAARYQDCESDEPVEDGVDKDATGNVSQYNNEKTWADLRDETICYAVTERDKRHDNERWEDVADVAPIDLSNLANHHTANLHMLTNGTLKRAALTYKNKRTSRCPWGN